MPRPIARGSLLTRINKPALSKISLSTVTLQAANTAVAAGVGAGPWSIAQKDSGWSAGHSDDTDWAGRGLCVLPLAPIRPSPFLDEY